MRNTLILAIMIALFTGCSNKTGYIYSPKDKGEKNVKSGYKGNVDNIETKGEHSIQTLPLDPTSSKPIMYLPNATAFRMSGDFADNVAVTLNSVGELIYFPAPTDITADSAPVSLGEGWWLNCQGLGPNSVFTKYTFAEYSALSDTPTPEQIKNSIIPGAKVVQFIELPVKQNRALENIEEIKTYISTL